MTAQVTWCAFHQWQSFELRTIEFRADSVGVTAMEEGRLIIRIETSENRREGEMGPACRSMRPAPSIRGIRCLSFGTHLSAHSPRKRLAKKKRKNFSTIFVKTLEKFKISKIGRVTVINGSGGREDGTSLTSSKRANCFLCSLAGEQVCAGIFLLRQ